MSYAPHFGGGLFGCGRLSDADGAPLRPGGLELTKELIDLAGFAPGDRVVDVGCGLGASTRLMSERGIFAIGVDLDRFAGAKTPQFIVADAASLPFADESLDGALAECSLSTMADSSRALKEWRRVLKSGGRLALTDVFFAHAESARGRVATREALTDSVAAAGFCLECFKDRSEALMRWVAEFVFAFGWLDALCGGAGGLDGRTLCLSRPGYCLLIASKPAGRTS